MRKVVLWHKESKIMKVMSSKGKVHVLLWFPEASDRDVKKKLEVHFEYSNAY